MAAVSVDGLRKPQVPKVSVVMAVYNGARYLRQAVDSILNQTWSDLEFIIVDDGSTDETAQILAGYADPRIVRVENEQNLGLTRSLNRGISVSRGELIARQDADDVSLPERLARQVAYLDAHPTIGLVGSGSRWIDGSGEYIRDWRPTSDPAEIQSQLLFSVPFLHGTFMFRRVCLPALDGGYNEAVPVAQDCDLLLRLSDQWDLANVPDVLYIHRRHDDTVTARRQNDQARYLRHAQVAALKRRMAYASTRVGLTRSPLPDWVRRANRRWLARRYVWWSQGARAVDRSLALRFLLFAVFVDPTTPEVWSYLGRIVARKAGSIIPLRL